MVADSWIRSLRLLLFGTLLSNVRDLYCTRFTNLYYSKRNLSKRKRNSEFESELNGGGYSFKDIFYCRWLAQTKMQKDNWMVENLQLLTVFACFWKMATLDDPSEEGKYNIMQFNIWFWYNVATLVDWLVIRY